MVDLKRIIARHRELMVKTRRDLHRIPEPAFSEKKTSAYIAEYLNGVGLRVHTGIAQFGVVGLLETGRPGKTLMVRSDMDALPVKEETGLEFSSIHENAMHACGHDGHMSMALATATVLHALRDRLKGTVKFLFQPAEEWPGGAKPMIDEGVMENPVVDYSIGCHLWPAVPEGAIGVKAGTLMAAMSRFDLKIIGRGGHGAMPHLCVDALEVGSQVINALQRITSRQMDPLSPAVVTVGSFHAGSTFNVIPDVAEMSGTTRTFDRSVWSSWPQRIEKIIGGVCESMGARYELLYEPGYPPLVNDGEMAELARECAEEVVRKDNVLEPEPTMASEDMAFFLERSKGCYFILGVGRKGCAGLHNPSFDFDEHILPLGVEMYCRFALKLLA